MYLIVYIKTNRPCEELIFPPYVYQSFKDPTIFAFTKIFTSDEEFESWFEEMKTFLSRIPIVDSLFKLRKFSKATNIIKEMGHFVKLSMLFNEGTLYFGNYQGPKIESNLFNFEKNNKKLFINKHLLNKQI